MSKVKDKLIFEINRLFGLKPHLNQDMFDFEEGEYIEDEVKYMKQLIKWLKKTP